MKQILKLNEIAEVVNEYLPAEEYTITKEAQEPIGVLVRSADMNCMNIPASVLAIARAGAGVNNIPCNDCAGKGVVVFNTPGANANAVKELVLCGMLMASRDVIGGITWAASLKGKGAEVPKLVEKGKSQFVGPEIKGKKLGVIGLGAIGVLVANDAMQLGMEVMGVDPYLSIDAAWSLNRGVHKATSQDQIFTECDYITVHVPMTDSTKGMINAESLSKMKDGVVILNFSRGELVNTDDMIAALESGKVARYVVDFPSDDILGVKNVIAIPHLGASTPESEENCAAMAAQQLHDFLRYGNIKNSVNYPDCSLPYTGRTRLAVLHQNIANILGQITAVIAAEHINISDMINKSKGATAYTLIDIDGGMQESTADKIRQITGIIRVRVIDVTASAGRKA